MEGSMLNHNKKSLKTLNESNPFLIKTNPHFFDPALMNDFGYQDFEFIQGVKTDYLHIERRIVRNGKSIQLPTATYEVCRKTHIIKRLIRGLVNKVKRIAGGGGIRS